MRRENMLKRDEGSGYAGQQTSIATEFITSASTPAAQ
jgi:hypothetical protein